MMLSIMMVFTMMPQLGGGAYADTPDPAESGDPAIVLVDNGVASNIVGGKGGTSEGGILFGNYAQSKAPEWAEDNQVYSTDPVKWRVLENASKRLLLLSDQNLDAKQYNSRNRNVTWTSCGLRTWLNDTFMADAFNEGEQGAIPATTVGMGTDKVFLLSRDQANVARYGFKDADSRVATNTAYTAAGGSSGQGYTMSEAGKANGWWLRSSTVNSSNTAPVVNASGSVSGNNGGTQVDSKTVAVRPAISIDLNTVAFTSAAKDGKTSEKVGPTALESVGTNADGQWKLTVKDSKHKDFALDDRVSIVYDNETGYVSIPYVGAVTGDNEFISAIVTE